MGQALEKRAREFIMQQIREHGEMTTEEIMELIRPHYIFDIPKIMEQALRRKSNQLMAQVRDEQGVRTVFNCKVDGVSKYINVDTCDNLISIKSVEAQLDEKLKGLYISKAKASRRRLEIEGQMELDLERMK